MTRNEQMLSVNTGILILRICLSILMLFHGIAKLRHGIGYIFPMLEDKGLPVWLGYGTYFCELVVPAMILLGWKTRIAARVYALNMLCSIWLAYSGNLLALTPRGGWIIEVNLLYLAGALTLVFTGDGTYSIERKHRLVAAPLKFSIPERRGKRERIYMNKQAD